MQERALMRYNNEEEDIDNVIYYKRRYSIAFYKDTEDGSDERLVACFNNPIDICKHKGLKPTAENLAPIKIELCRALKRFPFTTTRMLDGSTMKVYLIDMLYDEETEEKLEQERRDKCMALKKFVQITSTVNIEVYASLDAIAVVTPGNSKGDRLNAKSGWAKIRVLLTAGTSWYPSEILNWEAVKKLAAKEIITIGKQDDTISNPETLAKAEAELKAIQKGKKDVEKDKERAKAMSKLASGEKEEEKPEAKVI